MNFLGLIWIASFISSVFSPNHPLKAPDFLSKIFSGKQPSAFKVAVQPTSSARGSHQILSSSRSVSVKSSSTHLSHSFNSEPGQMRSSGFAASVSFPVPGWLNTVENALFSPHFSTQPVTFPLTLQPQFSTSNFLGFHPTITPQNPVPATMMAASEPEGDRPLKRVKRLSRTLTQWTKSVRSSLRLTPKPSISVVRAGQYSYADSGIAKKISSQISNLSQCTQPRRQSALRTLARGKTIFQVRIKNQLIAEVLTQAQADAIAQAIEQAMHTEFFEPSEFRLAMDNGVPTGKLGDRTLFVVEPDLSQALDRSVDLIAIDWINNLRAAFSEPPLSVAEAQTQMYGLVETEEQLAGTASWYGPYFHGRLTAAGETFDQDELTAAHPSLPFDTYLKVTNLESGDTIIVRINDRGPYVGNRSLDLSNRAARCLDSEVDGVVPYEAIVMKSVPAEGAESPVAQDSAPGDRPQQLARRL